MYFNYLLLKYIKKFFIVWFSLATIFVVFTLLFNISKLPSAGNLQVLYIFYSYLYSLDTTFSLGLFFGFLYTLYEMIKFNELVNFYSFGFSRFKVFKPFLFGMLLFSAVIIGLNFTKFAYANLKAKSILDKNSYSANNLFLKFNNTVVYIRHLNTLRKEAEGVKLFFLGNNSQIRKIVEAKKLQFKDNEWVGRAYIREITPEKIKSYSSNVVILKNFKPRIISTLKTLSAISFYDAYLSMLYFKNIDKNQVLSIIFFKIFSIVLVLLLNYVVFIFSPIHIRISNVSLFMVKSIFAVLFLWGSMLLIFKFAKQGILEYYILTVPSILVFIFILIKRRFNEL